MASEPRRDRLATLQALALAGDGLFDQPPGLLSVGDPGFELAELRFRQPVPPSSVPPDGEQLADLFDAESQVPQQSDDLEARENGGIEPSTAGHARGRAQEA